MNRLRRKRSRSRQRPPCSIRPWASSRSAGAGTFARASQPTYVFKDADTYVDLFSYHLADSNNDGIPNLAIRHDDKALVIDSQGYPNHPTAIFPNSRNPNRIRVQDFHFRLPLEPKRARLDHARADGPDRHGA